MAETGDGTPTLAALLEHRELTWSEVLDWSSEIAAELCTVHEQGKCHGDVTAEGVRIENGSARLLPAVGAHLSASPDQDILQFSVVLRQMIDQAPADADERLRSALQQIATTNSRAAAGGSMKKVSAALTLLRFAHQIEARAQHRMVPPEPERVAEPLPEPVPEVPGGPEPAPQVLLLAREVRPTVPELQRIRPTLLHLLAFLGLALTIAFLSFLLFLKLSH